MSTNCIHLKQKFNNKLECKKINKIINICECKNCPYKEYKTQQYNLNKSKMQNNRKTNLKQKTSKLAKLERNRFSLFSDNKNKCYFCPSTYNLTWHEIFRGRNRSNSMKYGLCLRICLNCHEKYQENKAFNDEWHKKGQAMFIKTYPDLVFEDIFRENYLK